MTRMTGWVWAVGLAACRPEQEASQLPPADPTPPERGELLVAELYTSGAVPAGGTDHYFSDQFVELVNASDHPLDLSGVGLAEVFGAAGEINPGMTPDSYRDRRPEQVVLSTVWRIPDGTVLMPGDFLVIAQDGVNHRPFSEVDLSGAGFESYVAGSGGDDDHPTVDNLEELVFNGGYDWLMTVFGPSVVVLQADAPLGDVSGGLVSASIDAVLDGVDTLMDADSAAFKRLPDGVDAGFAWVDGPYTGMALHRIRDDAGWQDTDDSSVDFEPGLPDPAQMSLPGEVFGEATLALGTGTTSFEALDEGATVELVAGSQGGWHIDATVQFGGFGPDGVVLVYEAVDLGAALVSYRTSAAISASSVLEVDGGWLRLGDRIVLDIPGPGDVVGEELVLRVTADVGGATFSDERRVRVVDEE